MRALAVVGVLIALLATSCSNGDGAPSANAVRIEEPQWVTDLGPRLDHSAVWTGSEVLIVGGAGGDMNDGLMVSENLAWNPETGFRRIAPMPGPPTNRHSAVWTGSEMIVFGGTEVFGGVDNRNDLTPAAYDPATDTWRDLATIDDDLRSVGASSAANSDAAVFAGNAIDPNRGVVYDVNGDQWSSFRDERIPALESSGSLCSTTTSTWQ